MPTTSSRIEDRYGDIRERLERACRSAGRLSSDVKLVAVSKRQPDAHVEAMRQTGQEDFGENLIQEWMRKRETFLHDRSIRWHVIGPVQKNKAKFVVRGRPALLHTLDRPELVEALERRLDQSWTLSGLIQVNIDAEGQKAGCSPEDLRKLAERIARSPHIELRGLMCIPAAAGRSRDAFERLRALGEGIEDLCGGRPELSMGMSHDFEDAIREGATIIRVGSALFGPRPTG